MHHELKTWPAFYDEIRSGRKSFDIRRNDRGFQKGDTVTFREWDPDAVARVERDMLRATAPEPIVDHHYSGRSFTRTITYVLSGWGLQPEHVALAIAPAGGPT